MRIVAMLLVLVVSSPAFAQDSGAAPRRLIVSKEAIAKALAEHPPAPAVQANRDSIANGLVIGAIIGAAAMGAVGGWFCYMLREPSDPPCWNSVARVGALGAVIGAGAGAGIDALMARQPRPVWPQPQRLPQSLRRWDR